MGATVKVAWRNTHGRGRAEHLLTPGLLWYIYTQTSRLRATRNGGSFVCAMIVTVSGSRAVQIAVAYDTELHRPRPTFPQLIPHAATTTNRGHFVLYYLQIISGAYVPVKTTHTENLANLLQVGASPTGSQMRELGRLMFTMYSQEGLPPDMFLDELGKRKEFSVSERALIVTYYLLESLDHKRKAGITDERVDKLRARNLSLLSQFMETGELGVY